MPNAHAYTTPFLERNHTWTLVGLAITLRLLLFFFILIQFGDAGFILPPFSDGHGYVTIAQNLLGGHGFSRSDAAPYVSDTKRVPLYPLYLAATFALSGGALWLAALLQALMSAGIVLLVYHIADAMAGRRAAFFAGLCAALYPFALFLSTQILAETFFTFILLGGFLFFIRSRTTPTYRNIIAGGALLGLAALVKPAGQYIPFLLAPFLALRPQGLHKLFHPAVYLVCFVLVISPWVIRNYHETGVATLSYEANILFDLHLAGYQSFKATGSASHFDQYRTVKDENALLVASRGSLLKQVVALSVTDPVGFATYLSLTTVPFVFGDGFVTMVVALSPDPSLPAWNFSASPSALGKTIGFGVLPPWLTLLSVLSKALWVVILLGAATGFIRLVMGDRGNALTATAFVIVISYFMFAGGPVQSARYRQPVEPLIFLLAGIGIAECLRLAEIHRDRRVKLPSQSN